MSDTMTAGGTTKQLALVGARLIDGNGGEPLEDAVVLIDGAHISAAGRRDEIQLSPECRVEDVSGKTIMPGIMDCHCHFICSSMSLQNSLFTRPTVSTFQAARNLKQALYAGVTTARDAGGLDAGYREAIALGLIEGPRLLVAGRVVQVGGHFDWFMPNGMEFDFGSEYTPVSGVAEVQRETRKRLRESYDLIKICATGGVTSPADSPDDTVWTLDELRAIVQEARARGKVVMAHAIGNTGIKNAVTAGVWSVEHGRMLDDEAIEMMVRQGIYLVPTLSVVADIVERGEEIGLNPAALDKSKAYRDLSFESFTRAYEAGVKIGAGTDAMDEQAHGRNARELAVLVELGMSPMEAIVAATRTSAEVCRLESQVGTLEAGKYADLLLVDGDPLDDISILQQSERLLWVMKEGVRYQRPAAASD